MPESERLMTRLKRRAQRVLLGSGGCKGIPRVLTWAAAITEAPYKSREHLAFLTPRGYVSYKAVISHDDLVLGRHVFIGDRVCVYQARGRRDASMNGGTVRLGDGVALYADIVIETSQGGSVFIGEKTHVQPRCTFNGVVSAIRIGRKVEIASGCGFFPFNHGMDTSLPIMDQPCSSRGDIVVGDEAWLGFGVVVLENVKIGRGAVIGAGSVVTRDIPDYAIAVGSPAKVVKMRE